MGRVRARVRVRVLREACRRSSTLAICRLIREPLIREHLIRTGAGHRGRGRSSTIEVAQEAHQSNLCAVCTVCCMVLCAQCAAWCWCCFVVRCGGAVLRVHVWIAITLVSFVGWLIATETLCAVAAVEGV